MDAYYGSGQQAATGSLGSLTNTFKFNTTAGTSVPRETTILNKAFIQFDGLTAGYAQSMFDFYPNAYIFSNLRGSQATVALLAYTSHLATDFRRHCPPRIRRRGAPRSAARSRARRPRDGVSSASFQAQPAGSRVPEIIGNLRLDQPWGAVQLTAAAHQVDASLFASSALATPPTTYAFPTLTSNSYGFAVQGGLKLNTDYIRQVLAGGRL